MKPCGIVSLLMMSAGLLILTSTYAGAEWNESYFIREVLLKHYDPVMRPVRDPSNVVYVSLAIGLKSFIEVDMKKQTLVSFGWLTVNWYDTFLTWDVAQHPIKSVHLNTDMIWRPELVVFNTVSDLDQFEDQKIKVIVQNDGKVTWYPGGLFETFCTIDISHYPLDTQTCSVEIIPWSDSNAILNGTFNDPAFEITSTDSHPEWMLISTEAVYYLRPTNYWVLQFRFTMKRKVLFYVINIILPIVLLSLMNCLVFLLPVDSGEKMTVSVTVFLSFAVFMSLINDSLPQNSDSLCLFSLYVAVQMFLSVCSIVMAAVIVFIFDKDRESSSAVSSPLAQPKSPKLPEGKVAFDPADLYSEHTSAMSSNETLDSTCSSFTNGSVTNNADAPASNGINGSRFTNGTTDAGSKPPLPHTDAEKNPHHLSLTAKLAWRLMTKVSSLTPREKRLLSRSLDKTCFVVTVSINLISCLTFILLIVMM